MSRKINKCGGLIFLLFNDSFVAVTERNFDLPRDPAILARDDKFYPSELILRQTIIKNLKNTVDAAIELPLLRFRIVGTAHTIWQSMDASVRNISGLQAC